MEQLLIIAAIVLLVAALAWGFHWALKEPLAPPRLSDAFITPEQVDDPDPRVREIVARCWNASANGQADTVHGE